MFLGDAESLIYCIFKLLNCNVIAVSVAIIIIINEHPEPVILSDEHSEWLTVSGIGVIYLLNDLL